jgi:hypothetical protein
LFRKKLVSKGIRAGNLLKIAMKFPRHGKGRMPPTEQVECIEKILGGEDIEGIYRGYAVKPCY